jgi:hypothetical protein
VTDVLPEWQNLKFKGKGQKNTPCMAILGLQKMFLTEENKKETILSLSISNIMDEQNG